MPLQLLAKARPREGIGSSAQAPAHRERSLRVTFLLHTFPPEDFRGIPRNWPYRGPAALLNATRRWGGPQGLDTKAVTMVEGALNTGSCPEQLRCRNSWSVGAW